MRRTHLILSLVSHPTKNEFIPVFTKRPPRLSAQERAVRAACRLDMVRALRRRSGIGYRAALKYVTQLALPRIEGTLSLRRPARELEHQARMVRLAGMVC